MTSFRRFHHYATMALATVALAACASKMQPAQQMIANIEATVAAATPEAAKYAPNQLKDVQKKVDVLKSSFAEKDYTTVITAAPSVLASAQGLAAAAAQKKSVVIGELNEEWSRSTADLPANIAAIQKRIDVISRNWRLRKGINVVAAKKTLADVNSSWAGAQSDFSSGNLQQAVATAKDLQGKVQSLAASIKLQLPAPADSTASN
ncbi:MAG TPA: hypothetical protein VMU86_02495 [Steroidobacteraceae bacterium]|nr:hypothetical protein [Steroidobacteraceae bacterium]